MKRAAPAGKTPPKALAFFFAARPKTLPAALAPVLLGSACAAAAGGFRAVPAALAALFALFAQIASNLANDRGDFLRGTDKADRAGFARATASGWLSPREVAAGTGVALALAALFGSGLIFYGGAAMIAVGAISLLACLAYTSGPFPLSYHGLGDVFVVVFFGFVAVAFTCYVQAGTFPPFLWTTALACGLGADNILIVNNIRDRATDERSGKRTTVVRFGEAWARKLFVFNFAVIFLSPLVRRADGAAADDSAADSDRGNPEESSRNQGSARMQPAACESRGNAAALRRFAKRRAFPFRAVMPPVSPRTHGDTAKRNVPAGISRERFFFLAAFPPRSGNAAQPS